MLINTTRFGKIEVDENRIIQFPSGLLGFSNEASYALLDDEIGSPFQWLQSITNHNLAFITIDPTIAVSDYEVSISEQHLKKLGASALEDLMILSIVTMTQDIKDVTLNLRGPLVIHSKRLVGIQLVLSDMRYSTRHLLFGDKLHFEQQEPVATAPSESTALAG